MPIDNLKPGQSSESFPTIQTKNLQNLIKVLGTKQSIEALTALGKTDKETWGKIADSVTGLKDFVIGGGISAFKEEIRTIVKEEADGIFAPIMNEFQPLIAEIYEAFLPIFPYIVNAITWIVTIIKPGVEGIKVVIDVIIGILTGTLPTALEAFGETLPEIMQGAARSVNYEAMVALLDKLGIGGLPEIENPESDY